MSTPSRGSGRPDRAGQPTGRTGGPGASQPSRSGGRRAGASGQPDRAQGQGRGQGQSQARDRASGSGRAQARGSRQEPGASRWSASGTSGDRTADGKRRGTAPSSSGRRDASSQATPSGGSPARSGSPRQGSVGRGSWDRNRSDRDRAPDAQRSGGSYSARGRAEPRKSAARRSAGAAREAHRDDRRSAPRSEPRASAPDPGPAIPDWAQPNLLEDAVRDELSSLAHASSATVAGHLVATGEFLDEDPQLALAHARAARASASRLACVREAVGVAAYHAGEYAEASRELRAYRRLSGRAEYLAVLADCERAAGRPEAALRLLAEAPRTHPGHSEWVEQQIVEAGARRDLGEVGGAILVLRDALKAIRKGAGAGVDADDLIRLRYTYADSLEAAGRNDEAVAEFAAIAESDGGEMTDAAHRAGLSVQPEEDR